MSRRNQQIVPRNGHTLVVGIVTRISGGPGQKEVSLDDQADHAKDEVKDLYSGEVEYRIIKTTAKGERLDREELREVERMIRSRELDVLIMEDLGRLIRGPAAAKLWGLAVDHGTRCLAPNDCLDTADDNWYEEILTACREHVAHNSHISKRIKHKTMNRFRKFGGAVGLEIAGYVKPDGSKTYSEWKKVESLTPTIQAGAELLQRTGNCSQVADYFNREGMPPGKYFRDQTWDGHKVRRYFANPILKGMPSRGTRHTVKIYETGRRVSVPNPDGPTFIDVPDLAHLDPAVFDALNEFLSTKNKNRGRKPQNGLDPRSRVPRKRTRFPGQHARCWYCGKDYIWGANGMRDRLMCSGSREWKCWHSIGFDGPRLSGLLVQVIQAELEGLNGFDEQFRDLVRRASQDVSRDIERRRRELHGKEAQLRLEKDNLVAALRSLGPRPLIEEQLNQIEKEKKELAMLRQSIEHSSGRTLQLPESVAEIRELFQDQFRQLASESWEFADLLRVVVPEIYFYSVRHIDGGHLLPRAMVTLNLAGISPDATQLPDSSNLLTRRVTLDLFDPPQRERIRAEAVELRAKGLTLRAIGAAIAEQPTLPAVQHALALHEQMIGLGVDSPYITVMGPPDDYPKLRRHRNARYAFSRREGYVQPPLQL